MKTKQPEPFYSVTLYRISIGLPYVTEMDRTGTTGLYWDPVISQRIQARCEIIYVMGGVGRIGIENVWHDAHAHQVFFTPPSTHLDLVTQEKDKLDLLYAHFQMYNDRQYRRLGGPPMFILQRIGAKEDEAYPNLLCLPDCLSLPENNTVLEYLLKALETLRAKEAGYHQEASLFLLAALHQLSATFLKSLSKATSLPGTRARALAKQIRSYICARPTQFSGAAELGEAFGMSSRHLARVFRQAYGEGVRTFANRLRIERAGRALRNFDKSIDEIAKECGFSSTNYFRRVFRKSFGLTPMEFRALRCTDSISSDGVLGGATLGPRLPGDIKRGR